MLLTTVKQRVVLQEVNGYVKVPGREHYDQNQVTLAQAITAIDAVIGSAGLVMYADLNVPSGLRKSVTLEFNHPTPNVDIYQIIRDLA